jgi:transposase
LWSREAQLGADISRVLEYVAAHFKEHVYQRAKYACGTCKDGVSTAAGRAKVIEKSSVDASVLAQVVVSKFCDHTPLHRQHRIYDRGGVSNPVSTLFGWVASVADRIMPLVDVLAARVLRAYVVRTDATGLKVLEPKSAANIERGTLWCYVGDDRDVVFRYTPTGEGAPDPGSSWRPARLHPGGCRRCLRPALQWPGGQRHRSGLLGARTPKVCGAR